MKLTRKVLSTSMIAAAGAVPLALACSGAANADPAPAPAVPGAPLVNEIAGLPGAAPQILQGVSSALSGAATPAAPAAPAPGATASVTLPQMPATAPAATAPAGVVPGSVVPAATGPSMLPSADVNLPQVPGLPLPQKVNIPGDLTNLLSSGVNLAPTAVNAVAPVAGAPAAAAPIATAPVAAEGPLSLAPLLTAGLP